MEGVTIRRPRIAAGEIPVHQIMRLDGGRLNMYNCVFDNSGSLGHCISATGINSGGIWERAVIKGGSQDNSGLVVESGANIQLVDVSELMSIPLDSTFVSFSQHLLHHDTQGRVCENSGAAITCRDKSVVALSSCIMERNGVDAILKDENVAQTESSTAALILS